MPRFFQPAPRFNSIVVRLKVCRFHSPTHAQSCFNSIVVRLKVEACVSGRMEKTGFNSIVVRLKVMRILSISPCIEVSIP